MRVILSSRQQFSVGVKVRQSETFQTVLFSSETNDKIARKRPAEPRLSTFPASQYLAIETLER